LQIHRIIREKLHNEMTKSRIEHYEKLLPEVANICSEQERQAEDIEHKIDDYLQTRFMLDKI
jgi:ribonuclease R